MFAIIQWLSNFAFSLYRFRNVQKSACKTFKDECKGVKEMRNGHRLDHRREENSLYKSKPDAMVEPVGGNELMNQLQKASY